ncbi:MAG: enoyl-CoA hydratase/isomerase family protein [Planctomycetes bacterium]|nr:enoyl-CoA hydratase/isomerase family protein [Planctomycetota bacterium]
MEFINIKIEKADGIAVVTINRPKVLNALNIETVSEIRQAFMALREDAEVQAVILTGEGEKSFCAGADIEEIKVLEGISGANFAHNGQCALNAIEKLQKPVIAAVNGFALGGGCEVALACHMRIASRNAKIGLPEVSLGVIPGYGGTQRLARLVGKGKALEMILSAQIINAEEAHRIGLVNSVVEQADLLETAKTLAKSIMKQGPVAIRLALDSVSRGLEMTLEQGLAIEAKLFGLVCSTEDKTEGTTAFIEKRKPNFKNA